MLVVVCVVVAVATVCWIFNVTLRRRTLPSSGRAVFITGCDRGFGQLLAVRLASLGYRVFAGCLDATSEGAATLRSLTSCDVHVIQLDVTDDRQVAEARSFVDGHLSGHRLWAVVNNAGIANFAEAEWCPLGQYRAVMDVNWLGTVRVTKAFLPLVRACAGRVVNVASICGRVAVPGMTSYSSSKFAVVGFSDSLRREMFKFGVKVITIEPVLYRTAISDANTLTRQNRQMWEDAGTSQEVRHHYGDAYLEAFLAKLASLSARSSDKVHEVVDDIIHAVTSVRPYTRYVPNALGALQPIDALCSSPNLFQDWALDMIFGVPVTPKSTKLSP